jgi:hypothetical protein
MLIKLAGILDPRSRRGYVGRHRASPHLRYVARVPVPHPAPGAEPADTST